MSGMDKPGTAVMYEKLKTDFRFHLQTYNYKTDHQGSNDRVKWEKQPPEMTKTSFSQIREK